MWFFSENVHPAPIETSASIINLWYWSTDSYQTTFFNDYVFFGLKNDILKRIIANGESESLSRFK